MQALKMSPTVRRVAAPTVRPQRLARLVVTSATTSNDIKNGMSLKIDGNPMRVIEFLHVKPGKGSAFVRTKLKVRTRKPPSEADYFVLSSHQRHVRARILPPGAASGELGTSDDVAPSYTPMMSPWRGALGDVIFTEGRLPGGKGGAYGALCTPARTGTTQTTRRQAPPRRHFARRRR